MSYNIPLAQALILNALAITGGTTNPQVRFVDSLAAEGGDGSMARPWRDIATALDNRPAWNMVDAKTHVYTVIVMGGVYDPPPSGILHSVGTVNFVAVGKVVMQNLGINGLELRPLAVVPPWGNSTFSFTSLAVPSMPDRGLSGYDVENGNFGWDIQGPLWLENLTGGAVFDMTLHLQGVRSVGDTLGTKHGIGIRYGVTDGTIFRVVAEDCALEQVVLTQTPNGLGSATFDRCAVGHLQLHGPNGAGKFPVSFDRSNLQMVSDLTDRSLTLSGNTTFDARASKCSITGGLGVASSNSTYRRAGPTHSPEAEAHTSADGRPSMPDRSTAVTT